MTKESKENIITRRICEHDYNGDSLVLGNVSSKMMSITEKKIIPRINQNIAIINLKNSDMAAADYTGNEDIIIEYFWGFIHRYIYSNPELRQMYIDSDAEEKIRFFNSLLGKPINPEFLNNKNLLFCNSFTTELIRERGKCRFKVCLLNYQEITSLAFAEYINLITRERPQLTILTEEFGLKTNSTGTFYTSIDQDFYYFSVGDNNSSEYRLEKLKNK